MSTRTRKDVILWGALGCALVSTAHAEYTLATAAHFNEYVALAVPGALDLYVVRALQQRRDVFVAVLAMVAANVASHLIAGGVLQVGWQVIAAVGAVAPLIVWRVYSLKYTRVRSDLGSTRETSAVSALVPESVPAPSTAPSAPGYAYPPAPDRVPDWMASEYPPSTPVLAPGTEDHDDHFIGPEREYGTSAVPYLKPVPDLPSEYVASAVHSSALEGTDWAFVAGAREYTDKYPNPSVRGLMAALNIGQKRAQRLLAHLEVQP